MRKVVGTCISVVASVVIGIATVYAAPCPDPDNVAPNPPTHLATQYNSDTDEIVSMWSWDRDNGPASCPNGVGYCDTPTGKSWNTKEVCTNKRFGFRIKGTPGWTYTYDQFFKISCTTRRGQTLAIEAIAIDADVVTPMTANISTVTSSVHVSCPANRPGECVADGCKKQGATWSCSTTEDKCKAGNVCPPNSSSTVDFKQLAEQSFLLTYPPGKIPDNCTETPAGSGTYRCVFSNICAPPYTGGGTVTSGECKKESNVWKKINCSGRCPGPSGGEPVQGPCIACGEPNVDSGVCAIQQPGGEVFDSCCPGSVAERTGDSCTCVPSKDAVYRLFDIINGIVMPIVVILGIFQIVLKGYKIMTSQGDPTALQEGKEGLTSAIIGLIFVLMAVSILRVIIKALITGDADPLPI